MNEYTIRLYVSAAWLLSVKIYYYNIGTVQGDIIIEIKFCKGRKKKAAAAVHFDC
jgi:hypothetical protein